MTGPWEQSTTFSAAMIDELRSRCREANRRTELLQIKALDARQESALYCSASHQLTDRAQALEAEARLNEIVDELETASVRRAAADKLKTLAMENHEKAQTQQGRAQDFEREARDQDALAQRLEVLIGLRGA